MAINNSFRIPDSDDGSREIRNRITSPSEGEIEGRQVAACTVLEEPLGVALLAKCGPWPFSWDFISTELQGRVSRASAEGFQIAFQIRIIFLMLPTCLPQEL